MKYKHCYKCGAVLRVGTNWHKSHAENRDCICIACSRERSRQYLHKLGGRSATGNKKCSLYLGVVVAEALLSKIFNRVDRMPNGNKGFDFICGGGYMIDVKAATRSVRNHRSDRWAFEIRYNTFADYFLCIAFDDRNDLNPEHLWLICGADVNTHKKISISESMLYKWDKYRLDGALLEAQAQCDILKIDTMEVV